LARLDVHAPCHGSNQANSEICLAAGETEIAAVGYELDDQARVVLDLDLERSLQAGDWLGLAPT
jgi:hypothetical protein